MKVLRNVQMALHLQIREDSSHLDCKSVAMCLCIITLLNMYSLYLQGLRSHLTPHSLGSFDYIS